MWVDGMSVFCAAVDWGTSSFRLWLFDRDGKVLAERRSGEGLLSINGAFEAVLEGHLSTLDAPLDLPVVICGMAGARTGWQEASYLHAPCALADIPGAAIRIARTDRDVRILPGVSQDDPADVMRGEETQVMGAGIEGLLCLPGTHSKWVTLSQGRIENFSTWMTGEIFALMSQHSLLAGDVTGEAGVDDDFRAGFNSMLDAPETLTNALFGLRARGLLGEGKREASVLSGLLIGAELVGVGPADNVTLIADGVIGDLYAAAFEEMATPYQRLEATSATQAGLFRAAREIWGRG